MKALHCIAGLTGVSCFIFSSAASEFQTPFRVEAGGKPIDVEVGHAAPLLTDFNGDGKPDLLVGQFGGGKLRIYKNTKSSSAPKFDSFDWFEANNTEGKVPSG